MFEALRKSLIFNGFKVEEIEKILKNIKYTRKFYNKGNNIAFRGDKVDNLLIILKGTISTEMLTKEGNVRKIEELTEADIPASAFIFGKENYFPVDLIASQDVDILYIQKEEFLKLLSLENKILENFLNEISNKTQLLSSKIWTSVNNKTIGEKFCNYIKDRVKNGEFIVENVKVLAENFGVARPSLSRVLSEYVNNGKIERVGRNKYKILDKDFFEI